MAVTRIKNNQITTASGNIADGSGINASTKLQDYTITSAKIANNLTYGSDLTVTGNLTVNGQTTTIDTISTLIEDPIITLADGQTAGSPTVDIGVLGLRGSENSSFLGWNEANTEFAAILTSTTSSNTTVVIDSYADFKASDITATGNLTVTGNIDITGNIIGNIVTTGNISGGNLLTTGVVSATGNVDGGNVNTAGLVTATGNITGGNVLTAGLVSATGNVDGGNVNTAGAVTATGNITGGNVLTTGLISATGDITGGNFFFGTGNVSGTGNIYANSIFANISGNIDAAGSNTEIQFNGPGDILTANANFTYNTAVNTLTVSGGNIDGGNVNLAGQMGANGNVLGGNISTAGLITATGNITGGNLTVGSGNVDAGNVNSSSIVGTNITITDSAVITLAPTGNVSVSSKNINNLADPALPQDAATKFYVDSVAQGLDIKASVLYATANTLTNLNGAYTYNNGAAGVGATITFDNVGAFSPDGTAVQLGDRVLIKNEVGAFVDNTTPSAAFNGIYVVTNPGDGGNFAQLIRATDFDNGSPSGEIPSAFTFVEHGATWADSGWVCTTNAPVTVGTTAIDWTQFSGAGTYTAGNGIAINGTVISARVDDVTTAFVDGNITVKVSANLTTPNIGNATGNSLILSGNGLLEGTTFSATGNVFGGNVITGGYVSAVGNVDGGNVNTAGAITATGNIVGGNVTTVGLMSATGNVDGGNVNTAGLVTATGNIIGGNVTTIGLVSATGNVDGGNVNTAGLVTATGNITGGNVTTAGLVSATGNVDGGNFNTAGLVTATGNITGGNVNTAGNISATGDVYANNVTGTTSGVFGNITIIGPAIESNAGAIYINGAGADNDFVVNGTAANVFYVDAGTNTASFGSSTQVANALVAFNSTSSVVMPVGNTATRPGGTPTTGMLRFNTSLNSLELYNNTEWTTVGATEFTVIADEQFNGDGSTVAFTLASIQTTNSCIVSINGVVQIPTTAYSVSGTTLTFTEAPEVGDLIDVREITTTTTVLGLSNGNVDLDLSTTNVVVTGGNLVVAAGGYLYGDGTYLTNVGGGNVIATRIVEGTTSVDIDGPGGDVVTNVAGSNVLVTATTQSTFTGNVNPSANATMTLGNATNQWKSLYVSGNTIFLGGVALGTSGGDLVFNSNTVVTANATGTSTTTGNVEIIGNVTSSNLSVSTGTVTAGNIVNGNGNGVGNIGSSSNYFNTVFAMATSAQYADLAEKYTADAEYAPGTVVVFGGTAEVTVNAVDADRRVAGVVSTNPSYIMNAGLEGTVATVALTGRVPTMVVGPVKKGDLMVSAGLGRARAEADPKVGTVIGKALEDFDGAEGTIEVVVGRF